jgi:hypothetical protein
MNGTGTSSYFVDSKRVFHLDFSTHCVADAKAIPGYPTEIVQKMFPYTDNLKEIIVCSIARVEDLSLVGLKHQDFNASGDATVKINVSTSMMADILKREFYRKYANFRFHVLKMTCNSLVEVYVKRLLDPSLSTVDSATKLFIFLNMIFHEKVAILKKRNSSEDEGFLKYALIHEKGGELMPSKGQKSFLIVWKQSIPKKK